MPPRRTYFLTVENAPPNALLAQERAALLALTACMHVCAHQVLGSAPVVDTGGWARYRSLRLPLTQAHTLTAEERADLNLVLTVEPLAGPAADDGAGAAGGSSSSPPPPPPPPAYLSSPPPSSAAEVVRLERFAFV
jgi:hypothetical protein